MEENAQGAEFELPSEVVKEIRVLTEKAEIVGERIFLDMDLKGDCIPLKEWKGEE